MRKLVKKSKNKYQTTADEINCEIFKGEYYMAM